MATGYPGGIDTYVPTLDISGNLMIGFSRNIKDFPLNEYVSLTKVKAPRGLYLYFNPLDVARIKGSGNVNGPLWAPGSLRPTGFQNTRGFVFNEFTTKRYSHDVTLDKRACDVASWPVQKKNSEDLAQEAMTFRSFLASTALSTTANFPSSHVASATTLSANASTPGFLSIGTTSNPVIKVALDTLAQQIQQDTLGRIKFRDLSILMNSHTAQRLSASREIREYVMQNTDAFKQITYETDNFTSKWGLPKQLYGYRVVVEDTFYNGYNRGNASETGSIVYPDNQITMFVREGALESSGGPDSPSYSTCHLFMYEDMAVESQDDNWNRLLYLSVVDEFVPVVVAPVTGGVITNCFS